MKRYASHKASGVEWLGEVPSHWAIEKLKFFVGFAGGGTPSKDNPDYWDGAIPWVSPKDMKCPRISGTEDYISEAGQLNSPCTVIPPMSVLTVVRSGILQHSIPVAINEVPVTLNQDMKALLPSERVDSRFLAYQIAGCQVELREAWVKQGATVESIEHQRMADSRLALPPLGEQQAIADYLDAETARIDTLIQEKEGLIGLLREAQASAFAATVLRVSSETAGTACSRFEWIKNLPLNWRTAKAKHLVRSVDQGISPQCESYPPDEGQWGVLKVGCVNTGDFNPMESKALPSDIDPIESITLKKGDVLVSRANTKSLVGRAAMADRDYPQLMLSDKHYRLRLDEGECLPQYLVFVLTHGAVRALIEERATGASASMLNIDRRTILDLEVPLPPIHVQEAIIGEVQEEREALNTLITHTQEAIALLKELRAATIADAVLGRVDVR